MYGPSGMMRSLLRGAITALVAGGCAVLRSSEARADDAASRLHLSYEAPAGCPSERDFVASLSPRIQASWVDGADARSFDVRIVREGGSFAGQLVIRQPGTSPNTRAIRAGSCKAVAMSLVVFVAIALDPLSEPTSSGESEPEPEPASEAPAPPTTFVPRTSEARGKPKRPRARAPVRSPQRPSRPSGEMWTWSGGLAANHTRAPEPSWGARVHAELSRTIGVDRIAPALRLSWGWSDFTTTPERAGNVHFRLKSARLEAAARVSIGPCFVGAYLGVDVGSVTGIAADLPRHEPVSERWTASTGAVRGGIAVAPWFALELAATVLVPFERPRFDVRDPPRVAYAAPAVLFEGSAGVAAVARFR